MKNKIKKTIDNNSTNLPVIAHSWHIKEYKSRHRFVYVERYKTNKLKPYPLHKPIMHYIENDEF